MKRIEAKHRIEKTHYGDDCIPSEDVSHVIDVIDEHGYVIWNEEFEQELVALAYARGIKEANTYHVEA